MSKNYMPVSNLNHMTRDQALISVQACLPDDKEIVKLINLCKLDPVDNSTNCWREWKNHFSPRLIIQKNKKIAIKYKGADFKSSDIYEYSSLNDISKISKKLLFIDANRARGHCFCFLFLGNDDRLRYWRHLDDIWFKDPPISLPLEDIKSLIRNEGVEGYCSIIPADNMKNSHKKSFRPAKGWVTSWPPNKEFYDEIMIETDISKTKAVKVFKEESGNATS